MRIAESELIINSDGSAFHIHLKREELLDNVTVGGVASYMERAEQANVNLFI